jgi:hypothetical protein
MVPRLFDDRLDPADAEVKRPGVHDVAGHDLAVCRGDAPIRRDEHTRAKLKPR